MKIKKFAPYWVHFTGPYGTYKKSYSTAKAAKSVATRYGKMGYQVIARTFICAEDLAILKQQFAS